MDVEVTLDTGKGTGGMPVSMLGIQSFERLFNDELMRGLAVLAESMVSDLRRLYEINVRTRRRRVGDLLKTRLTHALFKEVKEAVGGAVPGKGVDMNVFNLGVMRRLTSTPDDGRTRGRGWFDLFEDGHEGRGHGSFNWGFAPLPYLHELIDLMSRVYKEKPGNAEAMHRYVDDHMGGRHGEGIMVKLDDPLFYAMPHWGTARDLGLHGHPGFDAWDIWRNYGGPGNPKVYQMVVSAINKAIDSAERRMFSIKGL